MIIKGKPELGLQQHQQEAYIAITNAYKIRNKASVVIPTGCGKSFISLQLMIDNKDKNRSDLVLRCFNTLYLIK